MRLVRRGRRTSLGSRELFCPGVSLYARPTIRPRMTGLVGSIVSRGQHRYPEHVKRRIYTMILERISSYQIRLQNRAQGPL